MAWAKLKYEKHKINWAGKILSSGKSTSDEINEALNILDNWRAVHAYPLHVFQITLKKKAMQFNHNPLISQRLKRVPAILYKLGRTYEGSKKPTMKLYQMQDIGGCRAVVADFTLAQKLYDAYIKSDLKHKLVNKKDYIQNPKYDGYRGFHLVYAFKSRSKTGMKRYNGLLTEIQIRTKLQHLWATAVETAGFFTRQAIKSNEGSSEWIDFFKLVSSAFAKFEGCPQVPNMPADERELYSLIKKKEAELNVITKMSGWTNAINLFTQELRDAKIKSKQKAKFFLLELDILGDKLSIKSYTEKEEEKAINDYSALEKRHKDRKDYDVVLVGAENSNDLKKAYPNYFVDTGDFLKYLKKIVDKYN
jgi:ppGpp synthetase/RelA/SpoT-type nucleotidyltranferase